MEGFCVGLARVFFNKAALISTSTSSTWECIFSLCYRIWKGYCRRYIWKGGHWTRSEIKGLSHQPYLSLPDLSSPFQHPQPRSVTWETEPYCPPACLGSFADWGGDIAKCRPQSEFRLWKKRVLQGLSFLLSFLSFPGPHIWPLGTTAASACPLLQVPQPPWAQVKLYIPLTVALCC